MEGEAPIFYSPEQMKAWHNKRNKAPVEKAALEKLLKMPQAKPQDPGSRESTDLVTIKLKKHFTGPYAGTYDVIVVSKGKDKVIRTEISAVISLSTIEQILSGFMFGYSK